MTLGASRIERHDQGLPEDWPLDRDRGTTSGTPIRMLETAAL